MFVIYSIKSKSLNIYHIYKIDKNSRGRGGRGSAELLAPLCLYMAEALSLLMKRVSWQKGLTRTTLLPL